MSFMDGMSRGVGLAEMVHRSNRMDDQLEKRNDRIDKADDRADFLFDQSQEDRSNRQSLQHQNAAGFMLDSPEFVSRLKAGDPKATAEIQKYTASDPNLSEFVEMIQTPEGINNIEQDISTIEAGFRGEATMSESLGAINRSMRPFINRGDGGMNKKITSLYPSPGGDGFIAELGMEDESGQPKRAPLTGPDRSPADTEVKEIKAQKVLEALKMMKLYINANRVALGDNGPISSASASIAQQDEREYQAGLTDEKNAFEMKKLNTEHENRMALERLKLGKNGGHGAGGKNESSLGSEQYKQFRDTLMKSMISRYGVKTGDFVVIDDMGNQRIDENRFFNSLPADGKQAWMNARRLGTNFMRDGGYDPVNAAMTALDSVYGNKQVRQPGSHGQDNPQVTDDLGSESRLDQLEKAEALAAQEAPELGMKFLEELRQKSPNEFLALMDRKDKRKAAGLKQGRIDSYQAKKQHPTAYKLQNELAELRRQRSNPMVGNKQEIDARIAQIEKQLPSVDDPGENLSSFAPEFETKHLRERIKKATGREKEKLLRLLAKIERENSSNIASR